MGNCMSLGLYVRESHGQTDEHACNCRSSNVSSVRSSSQESLVEIITQSCKSEIHMTSIHMKVYQILRVLMALMATPTQRVHVHVLSPILTLLMRAYCGSCRCWASTHTCITTGNHCCHKIEGNVSCKCCAREVQQSHLVSRADVHSKSSLPTPHPHTHANTHVREFVSQKIRFFKIISPFRAV